MEGDWYAVLQLAPIATSREIDDAYARLRRGKGADKEGYKILKNAYRVLSSPNAREIYDAELATRMNSRKVQAGLLGAAENGGRRSSPSSGSSGPESRSNSFSSGAGNGYSSGNGRATPPTGANTNGALPPIPERDRQQRNSMQHPQPQPFPLDYRSQSPRRAPPPLQAYRPMPPQQPYAHPQPFPHQMAPAPPPYTQHNHPQPQPYPSIHQAQHHQQQHHQPQVPSSGFGHGARAMSPHSHPHEMSSPRPYEPTSPRGAFYDPRPAAEPRPRAHSPQGQQSPRGHARAASLPTINTQGQPLSPLNPSSQRLDSPQATERRHSVVVEADPWLGLEPSKRRVAMQHDRRFRAEYENFLVAVPRPVSFDSYTMTDTGGTAIGKAYTVKWAEGSGCKTWTGTTRKKSSGAVLSGAVWSYA